MPIYSYRCEECGFAQDVLQKLSDPLLTECPSCGKSAFKKQLSAPAIAGEGSGAPAGLPPCAFGGSCMGGPCG
ncbi:MAG: FmdB family transcriptional regulator [Burkholderiaceae bacterium]|nr:FmdB family transcriptional regulator [Burkholderiaceae bacterium]